jgi:hypothetical protein
VHKNYRTDLVSLFVEGQPIVFEVQKKQQAFYFEPLCSWKDKVTAMSFLLERVDTHWTTSAIIDKDLFYQAVEEVENRYILDQFISE